MEKRGADMIIDRNFSLQDFHLRAGENSIPAPFVSKSSLSLSQQGEVQLRQQFLSEACPGGYPAPVRAGASFL